MSVLPAVLRMLGAESFSLSQSCDAQYLLWQAWCASGRQSCCPQTGRAQPCFCAARLSRPWHGTAERTKFCAPGTCTDASSLVQAIPMWPTNFPPCELCWAGKGWDI